MTTSAARGRPTGARASPLPPEERREAIVAAALPLLREYGAEVTTRQLAEAAGIAEGTIFRVFPDKDAVIRAAVEAAMDERESIAELRLINVGLPLRDKMIAVVEAMSRRLEQVWDLLSALKMFPAPEEHRFRPAKPPPHTGTGVDREVEAILAPEGALLRVDLAEAVRLLRLMTVAGTHPRITENNPLKPEQIVDVLLDGIRTHAP